MGTKNRPIYEPRFAGLGLMTLAADGVRASIGPAGPSDASIRAIVAPNGSSDASSRASGVPYGSSAALFLAARSGARKAWAAASIRAIVAPNGSSDASSRASGVPTGSLALIVSRRKGFVRCAAGSARTLGSKRPKAFFIDLGVFSRL